MSGEGARQRRLKHLGDFVGPAARPGRPSRAAPGSEERLRDLEQRATQRQSLFSALDCPDEFAVAALERDADGYRGRGRKATRSGHGARVERDPEAEKQLGLRIRNLVRFCDRLREIRRSRGFSLAILARRSGVPKGRLSQLEHGRNGPHLVTAVALARALEVSLELLAGL